MNNLPPAVHATLEFLYGTDKWWRVWAMLMTGCVVLWIPRSTRRFGAIAFVSLFLACNIWHYLQESYKQFTPSDTDIKKPVTKKWLH